MNEWAGDLADTQRLSQPWDSVPPGRPHLLLRVLETTDVHSNLLPYDYFADQHAGSFGLARIATLIRQARAEVANCLLLDNGDFLQGTPISDLTAQPESGWSDMHPAVLAMNALDYDAVGLGNHEFNFGLGWLQDVLAKAAFPVTCANAVTRLARDPRDDETLYQPFALLERRLVDSDGALHDLRIGVLALVPPQITTWDHSHLEGRLQTRDMVETARARVPELRAAGADIVIALAHSGIDQSPYYPFQENAALALAGLEGIDAILAGHTHEIFPHPGSPEIPGVDHEAGTLNGTPAVMAGFRGSHLGVLDLALRKEAGRWQVVDHRSSLRPVVANVPTAPTPTDEHIQEILGPAHAHTLALVRKPLGRGTRPLHSYLAMVQNDPSVQLVTRAQHAALADLVAETDYADLPILSISAPFKTGGRGGCSYYTDIPPSPLRLRNVADLYAFPNTLCGLRLTGADIRDWLERAAICFNQVQPGHADQELFDPLVPGHGFDIIHGLSYAIDLSQPARYDRIGQLVSAEFRRIKDLQYDGKPVSDTDVFLVATNSFRAHGGGQYPQRKADDFVVTSESQVREVVAQYVRTHGDVTFTPDPVWSFAPVRGASVVFKTGPGLRNYPEEIKALGAEDLGDGADGFARFRLSLDPPRFESLANPSCLTYHVK